LLRIARRQNAGAGPTRFLAEIALVHDFDVNAFASQKIGGGQADDAAADDQDIGLHSHRVVIARWRSVASFHRRPLCAPHQSTVAAGQHSDHDACRTGYAQGPRSVTGRAACGQHVIYQEYGFAA